MNTIDYPLSQERIKRECDRSILAGLNNKNVHINMNDGRFFTGRLSWRYHANHDDERAGEWEKQTFTVGFSEPIAIGSGLLSIREV